MGAEAVGDGQLDRGRRGARAEAAAGEERYEQSERPEQAAGSSTGGREHAGGWAGWERSGLTPRTFSGRPARVRLWRC